MFKRLFSLLPEFSDELDALRARLVFIGLLTLLFGALLALAWTVLAGADTLPLLLTLAGTASLHVMCLLLLRARHLRAAGLILIANALVTTFVLMVIANGFYDTAMLIIPLVFLCASFLLGTRDYTTIVALTLLGLCGVLVLYLGGWYHDPIGSAHLPDVRYDFGVILLITTLTAAVPWVFTTQLKRLLARVQRGELALRELNANLDTRVAERTAELERSNRELESANRELQTFERSLSHSLRTPLRHVGGYADILLEESAEQLAPEQRELIARMKGAAVELGQMGDALLAYARLNERPLDPVTLDPARIWRGLVDDLPPAPEARRIEWVHGTVPACRADAVLVRQALRQLLDNALKFSSRIDAARIEFGYDEGSRAYFVRDNGAGLDMAYADKLFKVFERLHSRSEFPGLGIGLAMVSRIAARHGGATRVESTLGEGTTVYFSLS